MAIFSQPTLAMFDAQALSAFLEHDPLPCIVLDTDYRIIASNTAYQRQFGQASQPHLGAKCHQVSHHYAVPCDQAGELCPMQKARDSGLPERVLHVHHSPRGPEHVDVELRPLVDGQGQVFGYVERLRTVSVAAAQPQGAGLVGHSPAFKRALADLERAAPAQIPVLLQGESGTGKELFARALHASSTRAAGPFVVVDCTGLSEALFESELFGYEKGAFTGAVGRKLGLAEAAHGGTLFLDEIGEVPLAVQVKLLRLIEAGSFRPVGSLRSVHADFRLVCATHKPLKAMASEGTFRQDLYYRISAFPIHLPALRERQQDLPLLVASLLRRHAEGVPKRLDPAAMAWLQGYAFPGNIRELRNLLERAQLLADDGVIRLKDLPASDPAGDPAAPGRVARECAELRRTLAGYQGSRKALAKALGVSERTLYRRLKQL
ncbi:sigma-54 interaction domain-containing protein [Pseudomonas typographi]|uniref:Sigma 54-interacting transcriptional regulator n=1 Tax=Pseudomonas typographi TaxID=2715964 RepID=A0ABR7Z879_9PSED|nr:sigma 54-interacting transcriptional regulator [Pseudomonas typographi]MBD1553891.1 sigma 54-interacting transcriptional regulator [Pseudomonas typographi]MBD1589707.1 sigma 54-interacting transcriptional regulator [Pseudomonas typographi]MBD1601726.1 sigma 54-interacting transcriptional regulator [Pseudomonas typographi]